VGGAKNFSSSGVPLLINLINSAFSKQLAKKSVKESRSNLLSNCSSRCSQIAADEPAVELANVLEGIIPRGLSFKRIGGPMPAKTTLFCWGFGG
jgi:hypothetical protein